MAKKPNICIRCNHPHNEEFNCNVDCDICLEEWLQESLEAVSQSKV